jgi:uncharacterized Zn finger protein
VACWARKAVGHVLASLLDRRSLRRLAGDVTFDRGVAYSSEGRVGDLVLEGDRLLASVSGRKRYRVRLWPERDGLGHSCTCPVGEEGLLCKHCIAVGLAWRTRPTVRVDATVAEIRARLDELPRESLTELLVEQALLDDGLRRRLLLADPGASLGRVLDAGEGGGQPGPPAPDQEVDAPALAERDFDAQPSRETYRRLREQADGWPGRRERALDRLRAADDEAARRSAGWLQPAGRTEVVGALLDEGDVEGAWREAREHGCAPDLWLEVAARREGDHPAEALAAYQEAIERTLGRRTGEAHREAIGLLRRIRELMARLDRQSDFAGYLASVREAHATKRSFIRLLDAAKLGG